MTNKKITLEDEKKAVKRITSWAGAGEDAYKVVQKIEAGKLNGEPYEPTQKETTALLSGALKMYFDGNISKKGKQALLDAGLNLDVQNLRKEVIEAVMPVALHKKIATGDIESIMALGQLMGEKPEQEIPNNAKRITRERVVIELDD